jgi:hypothetical protein
MNLKLINTNAAAFVLAFMIVESGPVLAGTVILSGVTGNTCSSYTGFGVDAGGNLTVTCGDSGPAPAPTVAPSCALTASSPSINPGSSIMLSVSCSPAATSFTWTGPGTSGFTGGGQVSPISTTTYSVTGSNSIGTGNTAPATVTVSQSNSTPNPPPSNTPGSRSYLPTSQSPIAEIKAWNYAFETTNHLPHNAKQELVAAMNYYKVIQRDKPTQILLPNPW